MTEVCIFLLGKDQRTGNPPYINWLHLSVLCN
uniref:Uncharacterized protein n=1 Tax=Rhizophora mucronata TaxID=61149 RepID=A0A2P2NKC3_RHIMU